MLQLLLACFLDRKFSRWRYAQAHDVQLPDEYDFIWRDLEPFWGIDPADLLSIQEQQERIPDSFIIGKNDTSRLGLLGTAFSEPEKAKERNLFRGLDEMLNLLKPVDEHLPNFRAVFSPHDNPNLLSDYHVKKAVLDAAAAGRCKPCIARSRKEH